MEVQLESIEKEHLHNDPRHITLLDDVFKCHNDPFLEVQLESRKRTVIYIMTHVISCRVNSLGFQQLLL